MSFHPKPRFSTTSRAAIWPQMSWVIPDGNNSDHPDETYDYGPQWIAPSSTQSGESNYWDSTAIIIVWDDWGGFYDNEGHALPLVYAGPGERVPAIIVSPYARPSYISNDQLSVRQHS